ncbi:MAG TPA: hypothetical protein VGD67_02305 [Pseudonocardiaceae bacterium]
MSAVSRLAAATRAVLGLAEPADLPDLPAIPDDDQLGYLDVGTADVTIPAELRRPLPDGAHRYERLRAVAPPLAARAAIEYRTPRAIGGAA